MSRSTPLDDMRVLFAGIPLDRVSTSMTINSPAAILLAFYVCVAEEQGVPRAALRGTAQTDILKEYIAQKEWIFPPEPSMRLVTDMVEFCARELPLFHPISISGYHIREAGSTAAQELAFTLADGFAYVEWAPRARSSRSTSSRRACRSSSTPTSTSSRRSPSTGLRDGSGRASYATATAHDDPRSLLLRFHAQTAGVSLTAQQPELNIVRTAIEALAAVLGGTQSLHTNSFDEAYALPTEHAVKIALRTQQILAEETGVTSTIDPLGGSCYLEPSPRSSSGRPTSTSAASSELGGVIPAIERTSSSRRSPRRRSASRGGRARRAPHRRRQRYEEEEPDELEMLRIDPAFERDQIERVRRLRDRRDADGRGGGDRAAPGRRGSEGVNLMPAIVDAARADVTMGEMCDMLRGVWGTWRESPVF